VEISVAFPARTLTNEGLQLLAVPGYYTQECGIALLPGGIAILPITWRPITALPVMMTVMIDDCTTHSVHPDPLEHVRYSSPPFSERRILLLNISIKYKNYTLSNGTPIDNLHGYHDDLHRLLYLNIPRSSFLYVALLPGHMVVAAALCMGGSSA
jgi:hypothetical protein